MSIDFSQRKYCVEAQKLEIGENFIAAGWAEEIRNLGKILFIKLRDRSGYLQVLVTKEDLIKNLEKLPNESVILVSGKIKKSKLKSGDNELELEEFQIVSKADPKLPIDFSGKIETDLSKRLDWRILDLRNPRNLAIFKIRAKICQAIREFLTNNGFIEIQTPKIIGMGAEGGATLFPIKYYDKKAYLAQSQQFYKQMAQLAGFDRTFEIGPSFRAEVSHTVRHLSEFTHLDVELSFIKNLDDVLKISEGVLAHAIKFVKENCKAELKLLNVKLNELKLPLPRISYSEAIKLLQQAGSKIKHGEDIGTEDEKLLGEVVANKYNSEAYFLYKFPWHLDVCKFYSMREGNFGRVADLEYKGQEIATNAQREHRYEILKEQIKEKGLKLEDFEFYFEPFKYGAPPHGGFGMGIDRVTQFMLNLQNIREAVMFPRDPERIAP
ncbi:MAG: aspartate--tRNA(Asn) ligase [Candidatus Nanoarchaeia archaeon]